MEMTGQCVCGAVRYEINEQPEAMGHCHCQRCRRWGAKTYLKLAPGSFRVVAGHEQLKRLTPEGHTERGFCASCGSNVLQQFADICLVSAGTLDEDPGIRPSFHMMVAHAAPWEVIDDDLPKFPEFPPTA